MNRQLKRLLLPLQLAIELMQCFIIFMDALTMKALKAEAKRELLERGITDD